MVCKVSAEGHSASWYKDGEAVGESEKYDIETESDNFTLTIPKSTVEDSGEFTIRIGDAESSANLTVNGEDIFVEAVHGLFQFMPQCCYQCATWDPTSREMIKCVY